MKHVLAPRSAVADQAAPTERLAAERPTLDLRAWLEVGVGYLPVLAWFVAGVSDSPKLAMAAYLVVAGMLVVRPQLGYLALVPMLPFYHAQGFAPHGPMFILSAIALGSAIVWCLVGRIEIRLTTRPALWCSLGFLALTAVQLVLGVREFGGLIPLAAVSEFEELFIILSVFAVGLVVLPGRPSFPYYAFFLASLAVVAGIAILHFIDPRLLKVFGLAWMVPPGASDYRASGVMASPNALGLALACGLSWTIVMATWQIVRGRIERVTWLASTIPLAGLALFLTFSRAAFIALGAGLILAVARWSLRAAAVAAAAGLVAAFLLYPLFVGSRLGQTFGDVSTPTNRARAESALADSDRLRSVMAGAAVHAFIDSPIAGHGFATFGEISPRYSGQSVLTSAHDLYLKVAAEQGLIGLGSLCALLLTIVIAIWRAPMGPRVASLAVFGTFVVFSFTGDSLGNAQTVASAFFLVAAGIAQPGVSVDPTDMAHRAVTDRASEPLSRRAASRSGRFRTLVDRLG